jgi:stage IV sporulation protein FB
VFFGIPQPTPFDLRWRMFGIDVRVHPFFWLTGILLGWGQWQKHNPILSLILWVVCVFVSILIHEMGHVLMGRLFGSHGHILLYGFGGLALGANNLRERWRRVLVLFAGPLAGFLLLGIVFVVALKLASRQKGMELTFSEPMVQDVYRMLVWINLGWGILNLLPIFPLDGGQISREVFEGILGVRGTIISLALSIAVAGVLAVHCLVGGAYERPLIPFLPEGDFYMAFFFGLLAMSSFQLLQQEQSRTRSRWRDDDRLPWE